MTSSNPQRILGYEEKSLSVEGDSGWNDLKRPPVRVRIMTWFLGSVFAVIVLVTMLQQYQIYSIQSELNQFADEYNMVDDNDTFVPGGNESMSGIHSRRRRHSQRSQMIPLIHLGGIISYDNEPVGSFTWTEQGSVNLPSRHNGIDLIRKSNDFVEAISVMCSGWYYVYAQIPYQQSFKSSVVTGHKIVRTGSCGRSRDEVVLQTTISIDEKTPSSIPQNNKYLGGIVYLSAGSRVRVDPINRLNILLDTHQANNIESNFFGLYLIKHHNPPECYWHC